MIDLIFFCLDYFFQIVYRWNPINFEVFSSSNLHKKSRGQIYLSLAIKYGCALYNALSETLFATLYQFCTALLNIFAPKAVRATISEFPSNSPLDTKCQGPPTEMSVHSAIPSGQKKHLFKQFCSVPIKSQYI